MLAVSQQVKNFIKDNQKFIQEGDWPSFFEEVKYSLSKYERCDLALMLRDAGIPILVEDVFPKEMGYTNYAEDDMLTSVSQSLLNLITKGLDWNYSGDLKGYPFIEVLNALRLEYPTTGVFATYCKDFKDSTSKVDEFRYILQRPDGTVGMNLIGFKVVIHTNNNETVKVNLNALRQNVIDYQEGFGIGYNKDKLNEYAEEKFRKLLSRLG